jgi:hypothetical protein
MGLTKAQKEEIKALKRLNSTELVQLLAEIGIRAHRGMPKLDLATALVTGELANEGNPFDGERVRIESFLRRNWDRLESQLRSIRCHGDCHKHNDMQVLACWLNSQRVLEREGD